jgi:predicted AAA+ superfamily ATPase
MTNFKDSTLGAKLENIVLLELLSQGWEVYTLKVYQKNTDNKEIDFVIKNKQVIKYIQVTHTLNNANKHREIDNLLQFKNAYEKICIFLNNESDNENDGVRRVDLIRWLLGDEKI